MKSKRLTFLILLAGVLWLTPVAHAKDEPLFVVHFTTGPNWQADKPPAEQPGFPEHSANLQRLRKEGRIVFGARYGDVGMIFLMAADLESARADLDADPGVVAGIFTFEIMPMRIFYPWQVSGASSQRE